MFPQLQAVDEAAVENQDQMPADPQEPLEETVESCLLQVMQGGWHSWYMMVYVGMFSRDVKCAKSKRCGSSFLEVRCMDLGEDLVHPWFARFCKHNFDVSEMCVCMCVFFGQTVLESMSKNVALYSKLWTMNMPDKNKSCTRTGSHGSSPNSLSFLILYWEPSPQLQATMNLCPPIIGVVWT